MKGIILFLLLSVVLETVFYPYPFTLLVVIMTVLSFGGDSLAFAFFAGLLLDLFGMKMLGIDSLLFLGVAAFLLRYNRRINFNYVLNALIFVLTATTAYSMIFYQGNVSIPSVILTAVFSYILLIFLPVIVRSAGNSKKLQL